MMYQNKIIKVFLREYYGRYGIIQREVGRLIKQVMAKNVNYEKNIVNCCLSMKYGNQKKWTKLCLQCISSPGSTNNFWPKASSR